MFHPTTSNSNRLFQSLSQRVTRGLRRAPGSMRREPERTVSVSVSSWINLTMGGRDILVRAPLTDDAEGYAVHPVR